LTNWLRAGDDVHETRVVHESYMDLI